MKLLSENNRLKVRQPLTVLHMCSVMVIWVFVWIHAFSMDITHDEAYSFFLIKTNYFRAMPGSANTHWLNSFFMKIFSIVLGDKPGYLRLQSVLAFPFFAHGVYRLTALLKGNAVRAIFYCMVVFNPYLLDFFALARGYGLGMTFQTWTIVLLVQACRYPFQYRAWLAVIILNACMVVANLSFLYSVISAAGVFILYVWLNESPGSLFRKNHINRIGLLFLLLIIFCIADLLFIRNYGKDLGYGGDYDMLVSTIGSVWKGSLYFSPYNFILPSLTIFTFTAIWIVCFYYVFKLIKEQAMSTGFVLSAPLMGIFLMGILFHWLFRTPFLSGRTALQWYIPAVLLISYRLDEWLNKVSFNRYISSVFASLVCIGIALHLDFVYNKAYVFDWYFQANTRQALFDMYEHHPKHPRVGPVLHGVYLNYYVLVNPEVATPNALMLHEQKDNSCTEKLQREIDSSDYLVAYFPGTFQCMKSNRVNFDILNTYPQSQNKLVRIDSAIYAAAVSSAIINKK